MSARFAIVYFAVVFMLALAVGSLFGSGVAPSIVPAAVATAFKRGSTGTLFQIGSGGAVAGNCPTWDASGNLIDSGIAACGGGAPPAVESHVITANLNGGGSPVPTGAVKVFPSTNFTCTITAAKISADVSGSITVDVWKANAAIPTSLNKISASAPVTLASSQLNQASSLSGWTLSISSNDVFGFSVATADGIIANATVQIFCQ